MPPWNNGVCELGIAVAAFRQSGTAVPQLVRLNPKTSTDPKRHRGRHQLLLPVIWNEIVGATIALGDDQS